MGTRWRCLVGQGLDRNPISVKASSRLCPGSVQEPKSTGYVQPMTKPGLQSVKPQHIFTRPGQGLDIGIQSLYRHCPTNWGNHIFPHWTNSGLTLDPENHHQGSHLHDSKKIITAWQSLDNLWTWTNPGHSLDFCSSASKLCIPPIFTRQKLDSPWTWTNPGQSLYLCFSAPKH